jgi:hypothetical protein
MKSQKLIVIAAIVCLLVGASGPAQAQPRQDAAEIIADFCEAVAEEAADALEKLGNAAGDLFECTEEFVRCRDGGLFGNDPLVECLGKGIECTARAAEDKAQACGEFVTDFGDAYEDGLRAARRQGQRVENLVQDFFNEPSPERRDCLRPAIQVGRVCSAEAEE